MTAFAFRLHARHGAVLHEQVGRRRAQADVDAHRTGRLLELGDHVLAAVPLVDMLGADARIGAVGELDELDAVVDEPRKVLLGPLHDELPKRVVRDVALELEFELYEVGQAAVHARLLLQLGAHAEHAFGEVRPAAEHALLLEEDHARALFGSGHRGGHAAHAAAHHHDVGIDRLVGLFERRRRIGARFRGLRRLG